MCVYDPTPFLRGYRDTTADLCAGVCPPCAAETLLEVLRLKRGRPAPDHYRTGQAFACLQARALPHTCSLTDHSLTDHSLTEETPCSAPPSP